MLQQYLPDSLDLAERDNGGQGLLLNVRQEARIHPIVDRHQADAENVSRHCLRDDAVVGDAPDVLIAILQLARDAHALEQAARVPLHDRWLVVAHMYEKLKM